MNSLIKDSLNGINKLLSSGSDHLIKINDSLREKNVDHEIRELAISILFAGALPVGIALGVVALVQGGLTLAVSSVALVVLGIAGGIWFMNRESV